MPVRRILVGVDGSEGSRVALEWALAEAKRFAAHLTILSAYRLEVSWIDGPDYSQWEEAERRAAERGLAKMLGDATVPPDVEVETRVVEGNPVNVLIEASTDADLLVVGSRGRGGLTGVLLGSVSQRCVERAHCPVVVVPQGG